MGRPSHKASTGVRHIWQHIKRLWRSKIAFRIAATYLALLLLVVIVLPWLPLPYLPSDFDLANPFLRPFEAAATPEGAPHLLGTDKLGRDVLSSCLYGARTAFFISVPVMVLATLLGLAIGIAAGYFQDHRWSMTRKNLLLLGLGLAGFAYYVIFLPIQLNKLELGMAAILQSYATYLVLLVLLWLILSLLQRLLPYWRKKVTIPVDQLAMRLVEGLSTIPRFVLILVLASFTPPSVLLLSIILVCTLWTNIARLARAEMMRINQLPYFEAAQSIGMPTGQLLWRHALPNLLGPLLIAFAFGLGGLLALESTLSFLNIGVPTTLVSWGRLIATIHSNTSAWWVVVFPGAFLTTTVLSLYTCSHYLTKILTINKSN
jgi:peptide/nickel transport system permease protein